MAKSNGGNGKNKGGDVKLDQLLKKADGFNRLEEALSETTARDTSENIDEIQKPVENYEQRLKNWGSEIDIINREVLGYVEKNLKAKEKVEEFEVQVSIVKSPWWSLGAIIQYFGLSPKFKTEKRSRTITIRPDIKSALPQLREYIMSGADKLEGYVKEMGASVGEDGVNESTGLIGKLFEIGMKTGQYRTEASTDRDEAVKKYLGEEKQLHEMVATFNALHKQLDGMRMDNSKYTETDLARANLKVKAVDYKGNVIRHQRKAESSNLKVQAMELYEIQMKGIESSTKIVRDYIDDTVETIRQFIKITKEVGPLTNLISESLTTASRCTQHLKTLTDYARKASSQMKDVPIPESTPYNIEDLKTSSVKIEEDLEKEVGKSRERMQQMVKKAGSYKP